jgi:hypothetical protein
MPDVLAAPMADCCDVWLTFSVGTLMSADLSTEMLATHPFSYIPIGRTPIGHIPSTTLQSAAHL